MFESVHACTSSIDAFACVTEDSKLKNRFFLFIESKRYNACANQQSQASAISGQQISHGFMLKNGSLASRKTKIRQIWNLKKNRKKLTGRFIINYGWKCQSKSNAEWPKGSRTSKFLRNFPTRWRQATQRSVQPAPPLQECAPENMAQIWYLLWKCARYLKHKTPKNKQKCTGPASLLRKCISKLKHKTPKKQIMQKNK